MINLIYIAFFFVGFIIGIIFDSWLSEKLIKIMNDEQFNSWSKEKRK